MGRKIGANLKNVYKIRDPQTGDMIILYYRAPTAEEMVSYFAGMNRDKYQEELAKKRIDFALDQGIITGFEEGGFEKENGEGTFIKFSSEEGKGNYDPDWRELLKKGAADILTVFSTQVFEVSLLTTERYTEKNS
jgi:hypothetical protein